MSLEDLALVVGWQVGGVREKLAKLLVGESAMVDEAEVAEVSPVAEIFVGWFDVAETSPLSLGGGAELRLDELTPESLDFSLKHPR